MVSRRRNPQHLLPFFRASHARIQKVFSGGVRRINAGESETYFRKFCKVNSRNLNFRRGDPSRSALGQRMLLIWLLFFFFILTLCWTLMPCPPPPQRFQNWEVNRFLINYVCYYTRTFHKLTPSCFWDLSLYSFVTLISSATKKKHLPPGM